MKWTVALDCGRRRLGRTFQRRLDFLLDFWTAADDRSQADGDMQKVDGG